MYCQAPVILALVMASVTLARRDSHMYQVDENLMLVRCQQRYCRSPADDCSLAKCLERSLNSLKAGECPGVQPPANSVDGICMDTCGGRDFRCPATRKCCTHSCGRTCQPAVGLDRVADHVLPAVPTKVTVINTALYHHEALISWHQSYSDTSNHNFTFVMEARSHPGYYFEPKKLGPWFRIGFEMTSEQEVNQSPYSISAKLFEHDALVRLRLGRWYIFRVAAVNENGTRGYSNVSHRFQLKERPKNPMAPRKFAVDKPPKLFANHTVYVKVTWKPQRSDYPTERYRISWSLHLQSDNASQNQSLWLNDAYVMEPTRYFEFWDLKPNSYYYVQLQALFTFGRKTQKSPIESLFLNTTIASTNRQSFANSDAARRTSTRSELFVRYLSDNTCRLVVRVVWTEPTAGDILEMCRGGTDCHRSNAFGQMSKVRPKGRHFEFADLQFGQRYSVRLSGHRKWDVYKTFSTPTADQFRRKHTNCL